MYLFKVIAGKRDPHANVQRSESLGFPTREAAGAFARGLAESGRCDAVEIKQYVEVTDDAPRYTAAHVLEACERAGTATSHIPAILSELAK